MNIGGRSRAHVFEGSSQLVCARQQEPEMIHDPFALDGTRDTHGFVVSPKGVDNEWLLDVARSRWRVLIERDSWLPEPNQVRFNDKDKEKVADGAAEIHFPPDFPHPEDATLERRHVVRRCGAVPRVAPCLLARAVGAKPVDA